MCARHAPENEKFLKTALAKPKIKSVVNLLNDDLPPSPVTVGAVLTVDVCESVCEQNNSNSDG